jgi:hypothetical protein
VVCTLEDAESHHFFRTFRVKLNISEIKHLEHLGKEGKEEGIDRGRR